MDTQLQSFLVPGPERLAAEVMRLLDDPTARDLQREAFTEALSRLGLGGIPPSLRAADCVLRVIAERRRPA